MKWEERVFCWAFVKEDLFPGALGWKELGGLGRHQAGSGQHAWEAGSPCVQGHQRVGGTSHCYPPSLTPASPHQASRAAQGMAAGGWQEVAGPSSVGCDCWELLGFAGPSSAAKQRAASQAAVPGWSREARGSTWPRAVRGSGERRENSEALSLTDGGDEDVRDTDRQRPRVRERRSRHLASEQQVGTAEDPKHPSSRARGPGNRQEAGGKARACMTNWLTRSTRGMDR